LTSKVSFAVRPKKSATASHRRDGYSRCALPTPMVMPEGHLEVNATICAGAKSSNENIRSGLDAASHVMGWAPGRLPLENRDEGDDALHWEKP